MKRFIYLMTAFLIAVGQTNAQVISVDDVTIPQGEQQQIQVLYSLDKADVYVGYGFVFNLPDGITTVKDEDGYAIYELDEKNNKFNVTVSTTDGFGALPKNETVTLDGTEGVLLTLTLQADAGLAVGSTHVVGVSNIMLTEKDGDTQHSVPLSDITFTVTIAETTDKHVILDETSTTVPEAATNVDVIVKRTIKADEWSTLCLPFAMTAAQVTEAFGNDVQLASFKGWESTEFDNDDNTTAITVSFNDVTAIEANTPYIIKVSSPVSEFTVDDVDIDPDDEPMVSVGKMNRGTFGSFTGSYVPMLIDEECLFLSDNKFWYSTGKTNMKGFRAYFYFQDVLADYNGGASARIGMVFTDEAVTGISEIMTKRHGESERYYNLKGQQVGIPSKGLYIKDGKKMVVK